MIQFYSDDYTLSYWARCVTDAAWRLERNCTIGGVAPKVEMTLEKTSSGCVLHVTAESMTDPSCESGTVPG